MPELALVVRETCAENPVHVYLASLSPGSRRTITHSLATIARECFAHMTDAAEFPWCELRATHTAAIRSWLANRYSPAQANKCLAALRGVLKAAHRLELLSDADLRRALHIPRIRGQRVMAGRALTQGELRAVFSVCDGATELGARDAALVAVLYGSGIRRAEAAALERADLDLEARKMLVRRGKGNKGRNVYLPEGTARALARYLEHRGDADGPLFHPTRGRGRKLCRDRAMSLETVTTAMARLAKKAGIPRFSPHDCRRTFVGDMLDASVDLVTVQRLAGHAQITTTARYDRRPEKAAARAVDLLCVPVD